MANNNQNPGKNIPGSESILDMLLEKSNNIEQTSNSNKIRSNLNEIVKTLAKREKSLRISTITIIAPGELKTISELIDKEWTEGKNRAPATYWQDKDFVYAQFISKQEKEKFLDFMATTLPTEFKDKIKKPNTKSEHLTRKPTKVEITNVRGNIKADRIQQILNNILEINNSNKDNPPISDFKEGKPHQQTMSRSIMFKINEEAFNVLFGTLDGSLPYTNLQTGTKTRLFMRINCKPYNCNKCFQFGIHQCEGQLCAQCGNKGHLTKDCKQKTKYCSNCKKRGHKARDTHCPTYLSEIAKELRKVAIPIEYMEEKELRFNLINHLQIK